MGIEQSTEGKAPIDVKAPLLPACDCDRCGNKLTDEELTYPVTPEGESGPVCEACYNEFYRDDCERCGERVEKAELGSKPGELIAVWREADAMPEDLQPGYYRVKAWPFYADYMLSGHFYADKLERVGDLDELGKKVAGDAWCASGPLCEECCQKVEAVLVAPVSATPEEVAA